MASRKILTHGKVRKLQRTLYQQAKKNPKWRAWSLYGDLYRKEFIGVRMRWIHGGRDEGELGVLSRSLARGIKN